MHDRTREGQALALAGAVERLRRELDAQRLEMRSRIVIEQAKGLLAERFGCGVETAYDHLLDLAGQTGVEPAVAAALLLGSDVDAPAEEAARPVAVFDPATYLTPHPGAPADVAGEGVLSAPTPADAVPAPGLPAPLAAARHLAAAAFEAARGPDELARRLDTEALGWLGATAVLLTVLEPDGALRVVGAHALPPHVVSEWARIPPHCNVGLVRALREGAPLWEADPRRLALVGVAAGLPGHYSCVPLTIGGRTIGAAEITWAPDTGPDAATRRYVRSVLECCARRLHDLVPAAGGVTDAPWLRALLDAVQAPSALMSPIRDDSGRIVDFQVDAVNADAADLPGHRPGELVGMRLLEHYPGLAVAGLFQEYVRVLETGVPLRRGPRDPGPFDPDGGRVPSTVSVRACRVGGGVLASWRFHADSADLAGQLAQAQRLGNLGWSRWDLVTGETDWSDHLYAVFGRSREAGPLPLERLAEHVVEEDLPHAEHLMRTLLGRREPADTELRVRVGDEVRHLRVMAEPVLDPKGEPIALHTVFQDVSQRRRSAEMLAATRRQLQQQRRRIAEERHIAVELQRAILPLPRGPRSLPGLRMAVRYLPAQSRTRVGGDWYEACTLSDEEVFLAIGDVSGHGLDAAAAMARLRNALSGLACTGAPPDHLLGWLNRLLTHRHRSLTASAVAARYAPGSRTLTWAQAGHPPPVLLHEGAAELLDPPDGILLGAMDEPLLETASLTLCRGDLLLLYTDGLVERRDRDLTVGFELLRRAVEDCEGEGPEAVIDHVLEALGAANPNDDTCLLAVQAT